MHHDFVENLNSMFESPSIYALAVAVAAVVVAVVKVVGL